MKIPRFNDISMDITARMVQTTRELDKMITVSSSKYKTTKPQLDTLFILYFHEAGQITLTELASELFVSKANMAGIINRLDRSKLITKTISPHDNRSNLLALTPKGQTIVEKLIPHYLKIIKKIFSFLNKEQKETLYKQLETISSAMELERLNMKEHK